MHKPAARFVPVWLPIGPRGEERPWRLIDYAPPPESRFHGSTDYVRDDAGEPQCYATREEAEQAARELEAESEEPGAEE